MGPWYLICNKLSKVNECVLCPRLLLTRRVTHLLAPCHLVIIINNDSR